MAAPAEAKPGSGEDTSGSQESVTVFYGPHVRVITSKDVLMAKRYPSPAATKVSTAPVEGASHDLRAGQQTHAERPPPA